MAGAALREAGIAGHGPRPELVDVAPHCAHGPTCTLNSAVETVSNKHGYLHRVDADFHNRLRIHGAILAPNLTMVLQTSEPVDVSIRTEMVLRSQ